MINYKEIEKVKKSLINLYLIIKLRKTNDVKYIFLNLYFIKNIEYNFEMERKLLQKQNLLTLVEYISSSIDIIISLKLRDEMNKINKGKIINDNCADNYEILLRKEEKNIREHIANENKWGIVPVKKGK